MLWHGYPQHLDQPLDLGGIDFDARQLLDLLTAFLLGQLGRCAAEHPGHPGSEVADEPQRPIQGKSTLVSRPMVVIPAEPDRTKHAEYFTFPISMPPLAGLWGGFRNRNLGQQIFQQSPPVFQQGGAERVFKPLGGHGLALLKALPEEPQERFGFPVAFGLNLLEFFLHSTVS